MKKSIFIPVCLLLTCLLFSFTSMDKATIKKDKYLPANCEEPIHFEIEYQEPCNVFEVNPDTGKLLLSDSYISGLCGNFDGDSNEKKIKIRYNVTNVDGTRKGNFIILDLEDEE